MRSADKSRLRWREGKLEDLVLLQRGFDITKAQQRPGHVPVISSSGVNSFHNESKVDGPGVVIGRKGTLGTVHYADAPYWPHDTTLWSKDLKGNAPRYVFYFLKTMRFERYDVGASNPTLNRNHIHGLPILIPTPEIQERIASILSAYDDLIENNRRRIQLLEESARLLYKEWFVHLRFPGHEHTTITDGVPEGWEPKTLQELCLSFTDGDWVETKDQGGSDYRLLQVSNVGVNEFRETGKYRYVTEEAFRRLKCQEVVPGDILISRMPDPIGRSWLVTPKPFRMITAVDVCIARPDPSQIRSAFLIHYLNSPRHIAEATARATGATRSRVSRKNLGSLTIAVPPQDLQDDFARFASDALRQQEVLRATSSKAAEARDLLLPRLMSGEVAV